MNRDSTIIQVALFLIVIAILGVAILKQQNDNDTPSTTKDTIVPIQEAGGNEDDTISTGKIEQRTGSAAIKTGGVSTSG